MVRKFFTLEIYSLPDGSKRMLSYINLEDRYQQIEMQNQRYKDLVAQKYADSLEHSKKYGAEYRKKMAGKS